MYQDTLKVKIKRLKGFKIFVSMLLAAFFLVAFILFSEVFVVRKISVLGNNEFVYNDVIRLSGLEIGQHLIYLDIESIKDNFKREPLLELVSVETQLPDEVILTVRERNEIAFLNYLSLGVFIDEKGNVTRVSNIDEAQGFTLVSGIELQAFVLGEEMITADTYKLSSLRRVLEVIMELELSNKIREICVRDINNIRLYSMGGLNILLGQASNLQEKLRWLLTEEFIRLEEERTIGDLNLTVIEQAILVPMDSGVER